ncbi:hypothetical protein Ssi02_36350 [Sinosporangium siamense]|uniref:Uncharacterized protein n=1 Tax=Sinosporangium siamense TaxID=1367973 RepID=A0A919RJB3_9ACTN|nr:hypothetical protein Ssi02_36350 [Sinosporangium siamense]
MQVSTVVPPESPLIAFLTGTQRARGEPSTPTALAAREIGVQDSPTWTNLPPPIRLEHTGTAVNCNLNCDQEAASSHGSV